MMISSVGGELVGDGRNGKKGDERRAGEEGKADKEKDEAAEGRTNIPFFCSSSTNERIVNQAFE